MSTRGKNVSLALMLGDPGTSQEPELVLISILLTWLELVPGN